VYQHRAAIVVSRDPTIIDLKAAKSSNLNAAQRNISSFNYFPDRLISLKDEYDSHKPQYLRQRWYDRRNPTQWWAWSSFSLSRGS